MVAPPLYEATFQIATKELGSWKSLPPRNFRRGQGGRGGDFHTESKANASGYGRMNI